MGLNRSITSYSINLLLLQLTQIACRLHEVGRVLLQKDCESSSAVTKGGAASVNSSKVDSVTVETCFTTLKAVVEPQHNRSHGNLNIS